MTRSFVSALAISFAVTQPALAAEHMRDVGSQFQRTGAFAGGSVRVPLGGRHRAKPDARLQLGIAQSRWDARTGAPATADYRVAGLELGRASTGEPVFYLGGRDVAEIEQKLGASTGTVLLVGAGVVLAVLVVAVATAEPPDIFGEE